MSKLRKWVLLLACGILAAASVCALIRDREPSYEGRPLSEWLAELGWQDEDEIWDANDRAREAKAQRAREVLGRIGPEAIPHLLRWVRYETPPPSLFRGLLRVARHHFGFATDALRYRADALRYRADGTPTAFGLLGPAAAPAVPRLVTYARSGSWEVRYRSIDALATIGPSALPALTNLLSADNGDIRCRVAQRLGRCGTNAAPAIPALVAALKDSKATVQGAAAWTLGALQLEPALVVPALMSAARAPAPEVRGSALRALLRFGPDAQPALPLLLEAWKAPQTDTNLAAEIERALPTIAPEALTNAPPQ